MTSSLEHDIVDYLYAEADRVDFTSTLDAIEEGLIYLPRARHDRQPHRLGSLLVLASAVLLIIALSVVAERSDRPTPTGQATASAGDTIDPAAAAAPAPATDAAPPETPLPPAYVPLPGGAVLNGIVPTCLATPDPVVFDCNIPAFPEPLGTLDYTGYVSHIVDETSRVSGGCRATNADATAYVCFIGTRAVDEQIIGEGFLGEWAPREYSAG